MIYMWAIPRNAYTVGLGDETSGTLLSIVRATQGYLGRIDK